jgi:membrane fusion protein (multidrug efflux system)
VDLSDVDVEVMVPERFIHNLARNSIVSVHLDALGKLPWQGKVHRMVPQADLQSRQFPVKIRISNRSDATRGPHIQAGMFAVARLPLGAPHHATLVPKDALVLHAGRSVVFVVESDGELERVTAVAVKPGAAHNGLIEIDADLRSGQWVVVRGNERLSSGQTVRVESRRAGQDSPSSEAER